MGKYSQEESFRMKIWMENKAKIEKHNRHYFKGVRSFRMKIWMENKAKIEKH